MENKYYTTIGLEIHAELKTASKMFCSCKNDPDEEKPNVNICPICMAHPGTLPVLNKKAIESVIKVGLALGSNIADFTEFDRKNYFYPDIPKGYQISQYKYPIVSGGRLANMDITRIHLEEDTANNKHLDGDHAEGRAGFSLIDFNRAGLPLMELVTEPHTFENVADAAKAASTFAKELQLILWYLDVSEANMEKGEMRVEANISITTDPKVFGTKVEVKNLNSFKSVERAILFEFKRMSELVDAGKGGDIAQETRGWDESKQKTFSQRKKEGSADYRYFPEPDLPKLKLHEMFDLEKMKSELPELPQGKRDRFRKFGLKEEQIEILINADSKMEDFFDSVLYNFSKIADMDELVGKTIIAGNYINSDILSLRKNPDFQFPSVKNYVELVDMIFENKISSRAAKDILAMIVVNDESPFKIATEKNLLQSSDEGALKDIVQKIISENPEPVASYKSGKENAIMSLVGKVIKESNSSANPQVVIKLLKEMLK